MDLELEATLLPLKHLPCLINHNWFYITPTKLLSINIPYHSEWTTILEIYYSSSLCFVVTITLSTTRYLNPTKPISKFFNSARKSNSSWPNRQRTRVASQRLKPYSSSTRSDEGPHFGDDYKPYVPPSPSAIWP